MLIPVKCFTCGAVLADKYRFYLKEIEKKKIDKNMEVNRVLYLTKDFKDKTIEGETLDKLNLVKYCCRRHMLTHVDIE
jgi:DNA-directed RNA polymerases I, II, and III subunit RPABC5